MVVLRKGRRRDAGMVPETGGKIPLNSSRLKGASRKGAKPDDDEFTAEKR